MRSKKKAVIFGIDYLKTQSRLYGCSVDAQNMAKLFSEDLNFDDVEVYTEQDNPNDVTMKGIMKIFFGLIRDSYDPNIGTIAIHFSGHGSYIADTSGDEMDNRDEVFIPTDYDTSGPIVDDWFHVILSKMNKDVKVVCTFDCCYSGTICDLKYSTSNNLDAIITNEKVDNHINANVILISGCKDDEFSYDVYGIDPTSSSGFSGAMSTFFIQSVKAYLLDGSGVGLIDVVKQTRLLINGKYPQTPVISSSRIFDGTTTIY